MHILDIARVFNNDGEGKKKRTRQDILAMSIHQIFKEEIFYNLWSKSKTKC